MSNQIVVSLHQDSATTTIATIRNHHVTVDRPIEKEGSDRGAMGGELLLAGLGGCFMSNLLAAVRARSAPISNVRTEVVGTLDGTPARFVAIRVFVYADTEEPDLLTKLVTIAERGCLVANTLRQAVELDISSVAQAPV